jgi:hypothetical protein
MKMGGLPFREKTRRFRSSGVFFFCARRIGSAQCKNRQATKAATPIAMATIIAIRRPTDEAGAPEGCPSWSGSLMPSF